MPKPKYNPFGTMTPEEFERFCAEKGLPKGQWTAMGNEPFEPSAVGAQRELLTQLRDTLQASVQADQDEVVRLKQQLQRLKHGGGS